MAAMNLNKPGESLPNINTWKTVREVRDREEVEDVGTSPGV